jgi:hypothetical protein
MVLCFQLRVEENMEDVGITFKIIEKQMHAKLYEKRCGCDV